MAHLDDNDCAPEAGAISLPPRTIAWPKGVSAAARARLIALASSPMPSGSFYPAQTDTAGWRDFIAMSNEAMLQTPGHYFVGERAGIRSEVGEIAGVKVYIATPETLADGAEGRVYLDIHGGGMVFLAGEGCRRGGLLEAERLGVRTISIDYRVPPDHPYPAALDDCLAVYRALLDQHHPGQIIVGGISGGANIAAALALRIRDENLPLPAAIILLTPELDLTESGDTFETLLGLDPALQHGLADVIAVYAPGQDLRHPYLSPLFADFTAGYPPTFLQSGTRDLFLSNAVRMHRALRNCGIAAELHVWEGMPHGCFGDTPEDDEVSQEVRRFADAHWSGS